MLTGSGWPGLHINFQVVATLSEHNCGDDFLPFLFLFILMVETFYCSACHFQCRSLLLCFCYTYIDKRWFPSPPLHKIIVFLLTSLTKIDVFCLDSSGSQDKSSLVVFVFFPNLYIIHQITSEYSLRCTLVKYKTYVLNLGCLSTNIRDNIQVSHWKNWI